MNRRWMKLACIVWLPAVLLACVAESPQRPGPQANLHEAARINTKLGLAYMGEGKMAIALEKLNRAIDEDPDYAAAHAALGMYYARRGNFDEAEKSYRKALAIDGGNPQIRNAVGAYLCDRGKTDEGLKNLIAAARDIDYGTPEVAWSNAGVCALSAHRSDDAERFFRSALQANPDYPDALLQMAMLRFARKDYLGARAFLERFEKVAGKTPDSLLLGSRTERALGNTQDARDYEVELLQKFPDSDQARAVTQRP
jgi:type IV pilus assembly protein PilF